MFGMFCVFITSVANNFMSPLTSLSYMWSQDDRNNILTCRDNDIASGLEMVFNIDSNAIMNIKEK
jgi:hypothetical protein